MEQSEKRSYQSPFCMETVIHGHDIICSSTGQVDSGTEGFIEDEAYEW